MYCLVFCPLYEYGVLCTLNQYLVMASRWTALEQKTSYMVPVKDAAMVHLAEVFPSLNELIITKKAS